MSTALGLVLGVGLSGSVGLAVWLARRDSGETPAPAPAPVPARTDPPELGSTGRLPLTAPLWTPLTIADIEALLATACECVAAAPKLADTDLVRCVWRAHWPGVLYPGTALAADHPSVGEALEVASRAVVAARAGQCRGLEQTDITGRGSSLEPEPEPEPEPELEPVPEPELSTSLPMPTPTPRPAPRPTPVTNEPVPGPVPANEPGPVDMEALTQIIPIPGYFYQVYREDRFLGDRGLVALALHSAVLEAASKKNWPSEKALVQADVLAADAQARIAYLNIIQCSPWNDALYGTWGYGSHAWPSAHGRAIRLIDRHDRVYDRLLEGQAPVRTLDRGSPSAKGSGKATGAGDSYELLWLPPLRADALLDSSRKRQVVAEGLIWADGSSKYNPPPSVQRLGILDAPAGPWGCEGETA